jgi:hypothetical protein
VCVSEQVTEKRALCFAQVAKNTTLRYLVFLSSSHFGLDLFDSFHDTHDGKRRFTAAGVIERERFYEERDMI